MTRRPVPSGSVHSSFLVPASAQQSSLEKGSKVKPLGSPMSLFTRIFLFSPSKEDISILGASRFQSVQYKLPRIGSTAMARGFTRSVWKRALRSEPSRLALSILSRPLSVQYIVLRKWSMASPSGLIRPEVMIVSGSAPGSRLARLIVRPATSVQYTILSRQS